MAESRRPPRPTAPRGARPAEGGAARPTAPAGPRPGAVIEGRRPVSGETLVRAETEDLALPWRRVASPERPRSGAIATEQPPASAGARVARLLRRGARRRTDAAAAQLGTVTTRLQARLRERAAAQRRLSALVWARRAGYAAVVAVVGWAVLGSPMLALEPGQVEVTGYGTVVEPTDVAAVVAGYEGRSLATLPTSRLAAELRDVPGVRDAAIERVWPRGLLVTLTSREPVAAIPVADGFDLVDSEATRVGRADAAPGDLPVVNVPVGEDHVRVLEAALGVINQLPVDLRDRVRDISASTEDTVTFVLRKGPRVEWGSAEDSALKASVLQVLLASDQSQGVSVIDVSAPTLPTTRG